MIGLADNEPTAQGFTTAGGVSSRDHPDDLGNVQLWQI
jgi:hypothetical protein